MIKRLCEVDVSELARWVCAIPLTSWPQQDRISPDSVWPAMVSDLEWHHFGEVTNDLVSQIMVSFPGQFATDRRLAIIVAGQEIAMHDDRQDDTFIARVHVPVITNDKAVMVFEDEEVHMPTGFAYTMDIDVMHGIANRGSEDRIHFFFDVRNKPR